MWAGLIWSALLDFFLIKLEIQLPKGMEREMVGLYKIKLLKEDYIKLMTYKFDKVLFNSIRYLNQILGYIISALKVIIL